MLITCLYNHPPSSPLGGVIPRTHIFVSIYLFTLSCDELDRVCFFVVVVHRFHVIKYSSLVKTQQGLNPQGAEAMRLGVHKKDEGKGIRTSEKRTCGGECER